MLPNTTKPIKTILKKIPYNLTSKTFNYKEFTDNLCIENSKSLKTDIYNFKNTISQDSDNICIIPKIEAQKAPKDIPLSYWKHYELDINDFESEIRLGKLDTLKISNKTFQKKIRELNEGESFTVGAVEGSADLLIGSVSHGVAKNHFKIQKNNGKILIKLTNDDEVTMLHVLSDVSIKTCSIASLNKKIQQQIDNITEADVNSAIQKVVSLIPNANEKEILTVMQKISQFGNYKCFEKFSNELIKLKTYHFCKTPKLTINSAFRYLEEKGIFNTHYQNEEKRAFILDEASLNYLENLYPSSIDRIKDKCKFIICDGFNKGINIYNADADLATITTKILSDTKEFQKTMGINSFKEALDRILNGSIEERAKAIGIESAKISLPLQTEGISAKTIQKQLANYTINDQQLSAAIDATAEELYKTQPEKIIKAKNLLTEYFQNQFEALTPKAMSQECRKIHNLITEDVIKNGGTKENIFYLIPEKCKSYEQVSYQYGIVNNIDFSKFITNNDLSKIPKGSTVVILDDIICSGNSMRCQIANFYCFNEKSDNLRLLIAPIKITNVGFDFVKQKLKGKDTIILDKNQMINGIKETTFYKNLSKHEELMLNNMLGNTGYVGSGLSLIFPYMGPDNNSRISSLITQFFVPTPEALKSDPDFIPKEILNSFAQRMEKLNLNETCKSIEI